MSRRLSITTLAFATALICTLADCRTSQAQGLLRRIQSRIQSRILPFPEVAPPAQTPSRPSQVSPQRVQPQRARPVAPSARPVASSARPVAPSARPSAAANYSGPSSTAPSSGLQKPADLPPKGSPRGAVESNKFGGSILSPKQRAEPQRVEPLPPTPNPIASSDRPSLAIQVLESRDGIAGLKVAGIRADSLADEAGLQVGDLIVAIDGQPTPTIANIARQLEGLKSGDQVRARIVRGRTTAAIMIPLVGPTVAAAKPNTESPNQQKLSDQQERSRSPIDLGITTEELRGVRGVVVANVTADSPAAVAGLRAGDRIVSLGGRLVINGDTLDRELAKQSAGDVLALQLVRDGKLIAADVPLGEQDSLATTGAAKKPNETKGNGSVLEGFGSMLGGLLGNKKSDSNAAKAAKSDAMAFGDEEPIEQVVFESEVQRTIKELQGDPPSLETLELPPGDATPIELIAPKQAPGVKKTIQQLREEVRQLEKRLRELEASE